VYPSGVPEPRGLLAYDGTDFRVPSVDSAGHLQVDVQGVLTGRVGSLFRWGATGSAASGDLAIETPAVPAGSWLHVSWVHVELSDTTYWTLGVWLGLQGLYYGVDRVTPPPVGVGYSRQLALLLGAGETLQFRADALRGPLTMWLWVLGYYLAV